MNSTASPHERRIPVTVLTGFLGAGKTTLLNHLVGQASMAGVAVLINEFGEVGVDHHLVQRVDQNLILLDSGCLCCTVRGDLAKAFKDLFMKSLHREIPPVSRVLIETTGLADPAPMIHTLLEDVFIAQRYRCDGIVTVVDALNGEAQLARHFEAVKQATVADRLLISKTDLAHGEAVDRLERRLARLNPGAERIRVARGEIDAEMVSGLGLYNPASKSPDVTRWLAEEKVRAASRPDHAHEHEHDPNRHDALVQAHILRFEDPLEWPAFAEAMDVLLQTQGDRILRVKGLVAVLGEDTPRVLQCVQHLRYPEVSLGSWPEGPRQTRLVFIVRGLQRAFLEKTFLVFCDAVDLEKTVNKP